MKRILFVLCMFTVHSSVWAWAPTTHAYIASCVAESHNRSVLFGAIAPDLNATILNDPAKASALRSLSHYHFHLLAPSAFTTGFTTHNEVWGADIYAHGANTYSRDMMEHLRDTLGITMGQAHDLFELCIDMHIRLSHGAQWGTMLVEAAQASGAEHEQLMVDAFAEELAARVSGLTVDQAEEDIRLAMQMIRAGTLALGELLETDEEHIEDAMLPFLAMHLGVSETEVRPYYEYAMAVTADTFQDELDYVCEQLKLEMPDALEGEHEPEGEPEGEGEPPAPVVVDFCAAFHGVYTNPLLQGLDPQFAEFIELLNPHTADVNGSFSVDTTDGTLQIEVAGNGILDAANELGLLAYILNNPAKFPPNKARSAVLDHDTVRAAWFANRMQIRADIGNTLALGLNALAPGLIEILTGYITLGDGDFVISSLPTDSDPDLPIIVSGTGSFGLVAALFATLDGMIRDYLGSGFANPYIQIEDYITMPELLPDGDADGDGYTNAQEYAWFTPEVCVIVDKGAKKSDDKGNDPAISYVQAALNYRICPSCVSHCPECRPTSGFHKIGTKACLHVPGDFPPDTYFDWAKEGVGPLFGSRYEGLDCQTLLIHNLELADSGTYLCTYGPEKAVYSVTIIVANQLSAHDATMLAVLLLTFVGLVCCGGLTEKTRATPKKHKF